MTHLRKFELFKKKKRSILLCIDVTREVRTNFKIMLAVSVKTRLQTQFRLKMYVLYIKIIRFTWTIASIQTSMFLIAQILSRYKYNAIFTPKQRVTRNKNVFQKRFKNVYLRRFLTKSHQNTAGLCQYI